MAANTSVMGLYPDSTTVSDAIDVLQKGLPLTAFDVGKNVADVMKEKQWTDWTPFSYPFNLTQQPACTR